MHGRVKVRTSAEQEALKKKERAEKLARFRQFMGIVLQKRKDNVYDDELMILTERILLQNPDIYTLWNIRREAFTKNKWDEQVMEEYHKKELTLTENCLKENPKSYYVWHQRSWIMLRMKQPDWKRDLMLCAKCLNLDERNFHCWDYRQFVVKQAEISDAEELEFSTAKILTNFSNYSSWHYRSRILSKMFEGDSDCDKINKKKAEELELVMNATFTDPGDSSAWFYQRWLLDNSDISCILWRGFVREDIVILSFNNTINISSSTCIYIDENKIEICWSPIRGPKFSNLWIGGFANSIEHLERASTLRLDLGNENYTFTWSSTNSAWIYKTLKTRDAPYYNQKQLSEQLTSYVQLSEMEPNNKWALLTSVLLMRKISPTKYNDDILCKLEALEKIDSIRLNYYQDLRSKYVIEHALHKLWDTEDELEITPTIDLIGLGLTSLREEQHLAFLQEVNLGGNSLEKSLYQLVVLQLCQKLSLSSNHLQSLKQFPTLPKLQYLSLRNNNLAEPGDVLLLLKRHKLRKLDLRDNPVFENETFKSEIAETFTDLQLCTD